MGAPSGSWPGLLRRLLELNMELNMSNVEHFRCALLLAGFRAAIEQRPVFVIADRKIGSFRALT